MSRSLEKNPALLKKYPVSTFQISRNEGRSIYLDSTGLDLGSSEDFGRDRQEAIEMLKLGRQLSIDCTKILLAIEHDE